MCPDPNDLVTMSDTAEKHLEELDDEDLGD
jgi:hypothetical protein